MSMSTGPPAGIARCRTATTRISRTTGTCTGSTRGTGTSASRLGMLPMTGMPMNTAWGVAISPSSTGTMWTTSMTGIGMLRMMGTGMTTS
ncbi:hypothetical protein BG418_22345 [Streptomyces sp. CBMA152]|nr:hypothetical protein [Streptomyces sp. CBMA152]